MSEKITETTIERQPDPPAPVTEKTTTVIVETPAPAPEPAPWNPGQPMAPLINPNLPRR